MIDYLEVLLVLNDYEKSIFYCRKVDSKGVGLNLLKNKCKHHGEIISIQVLNGFNEVTIVDGNLLFHKL
jgi:hypothetical protein